MGNCVNLIDALLIKKAMFMRDFIFYFCLMLMTGCIFVVPRSTHTYHEDHDSSLLQFESATSTCEWDSFIGESYWRFDAAVYGIHWVHSVDARLTNSPEFADRVVMLHDAGAGRWSDNAWIDVPCAAGYDVEFIAYDDEGNIATTWDLW
tara:strand:+ start:44638 stop:45084 length:447 start_codon:yes stop_codon:yes gene_type:complete